MARSRFQAFDRNPVALWQLGALCNHSNVGITMINHPWLGMVYTNYLWWWLGDGLWHWYAHSSLQLDQVLLHLGTFSWTFKRFPGDEYPLRQLACLHIEDVWGKNPCRAFLTPSMDEPMEKRHPIWYDKPDDKLPLWDCSCYTYFRVGHWDWFIWHGVSHILSPVSV